MQRRFETQPDLSNTPPHIEVELARKRDLGTMWGIYFTSRAAAIPDEVADTEKWLQEQREEWFTDREAAIKWPSERQALIVTRAALSVVAFAEIEAPTGQRRIAGLYVLETAETAEAEAAIQALELRAPTIKLAPAKKSKQKNRSPA